MKEKDDSFKRRLELGYFLVSQKLHMNFIDEKEKDEVMKKLIFSFRNGVGKFLLDSILSSLLKK